ncbi:Isochorismate synthase [Prochlorococcus marinus str. MIT 9515]|uniref:isochorismate synthase n=1 Tax=Prochlorococcus marinus (strain MIT 9515) TaxID=167542 RepID=A2BUF4_PROM5|nr:isochorismate synthase [Prochlorococcus marinus]ABM71415.1 Isochorismate synthase [Prochlorococcus marinus str. MIT 9515]
MKNNLNFSDFLKGVFSNFDKKGINSGLVSVCIEIPCVDLFDVYEFFIDKYSFSSFWEEDNKMSYIAIDKCKYLTLEGPKKFQVAKEFNFENFNNLINLTDESNTSALSKIIYFFSFSENLNKKYSLFDVPSLEAILPKILIIKNKNNCWLRINSSVEGKSSLRTLIEELWSIRDQILYSKDQKSKNIFDYHKINHFMNSLELTNSNLKQLVNKGIELVEEGILEKIVLASRVKIELKTKLNLLEILKKLKTNQPNTCRYVWRRNSKDIMFGASPEKLFSLNKPNLILEAIAGTSSNDLNPDSLLESPKDIKEHNYVINYLIQCLEVLRINNYKKSSLKVASFGDISHLQTLIYSKIDNVCPFDLLRILHPSPAVCGSPKKKAMNWINTLESFSRGNYASPMGWVDSEGNSEFRVAIRGARYIDQSLEFTAGSGIVKGSIASKEIEEIKLKFTSLVKQIFIAKTTK